MKLILKAYKFKLKPTDAQREQFSRYAGINRFLWNKALSINLHRLENKQPIMWEYELSFWNTLWKKTEEYSFLKDAPSQTLIYTLSCLDRAFKDAFDKKQKNKRIPKFKKKGIDDSFKTYSRFKIDEENSQLMFPKVGWIKMINHRKIEGKAKSVTISRKNENWYCSIQVEIEQEKAIHPSTKIVGIDVGIKKFATLSDGSYLEPIHAFRKKEDKLAKEQRKLSRKVKFSQNWKKQKAKIAKIHEKITNSRNDFLHKSSKEISKNHAMIIIENLKIKNMSKSSKGNIETPGKMVKQKSGLNKSIHDQGWGNFVRMLEYKQNWLGGDVLKVDPKNTSITCPCCGNVSKENRKTQEKFLCIECNYENNADVVGALNVLTRGYRELACEVNTDVMVSATGILS